MKQKENGKIEQKNYHHCYDIIIFIIWYMDVK